ncbi:transposase [Bacillus altitudinis]|nr:transposase [Bacillus altitudinis]
MAIHHSRPFYGYPRVTITLKKEGFHINHKLVYRLMKEMTIQSINHSKKASVFRKTSFSYPSK